MNVEGMETRGHRDYVVLTANLESKDNLVNLDRQDPPASPEAQEQREMLVSQVRVVTWE